MKKILFSPHVNFIPVIKNNFSDGEQYLIIGLQDGFLNALRDLDVENIQMIQADDITRTRAIELSTQAIKKYKKLPKKYTENVDFVNFFERIDGYLFSKIFDAVMLLLALDYAKPDIVILHNDVEPHMKVIALWANANNVHCLHVPHSVIIDSSERSTIGSDIHDFITASHIAVGGDYQKQWYLDRGANPENVFSTGLPQFDKIVKQRYDKKSARRLLRLKDDTPAILWASSWRQDTNLLGCHDGIEESYIKFLKVAKLMKFQPIIKIHPNSGQANYEWHMKMAKDMEVYDAAITAQHLLITLQASDMVIAYGPSNILLEASFYPVHLMTTHGYEDDDVVTKIGAEFTVVDLTQIIERVIVSEVPNPSAFRHKYIGWDDGKSNIRIADKIKELLI